MPCQSIPWRAPSVASAIPVTMATSERSNGLAGGSGPRDACTEQVESSTETNWGPLPCMSCSVRPSVGKINAVSPQVKWDRLILVEICTVSLALRRAAAVTSVSGAACTKFPPRPMKTRARPSRNARIASTVSKPFCRGGSKPSSACSRSRKWAGGRSRAHEELISEGGLVGRAPGCIEDGLVGTGQCVELAANQSQGVVPFDWLIMSAARSGDHGVGNPAVLPQPPLRLAIQVRDAVSGEARRSSPGLGRFRGDGLGAALAEFGRVTVPRLRIGPGAAHAVKTLGLIEGAQRASRTDRAHMVQRSAHRDSHAEHARRVVVRFCDPEILLHPPLPKPRTQMPTVSRGVVHACLPLRCLPLHAGMRGSAETPEPGLGQSRGARTDVVTDE